MAHFSLAFLTAMGLLLGEVSCVTMTPEERSSLIRTETSLIRRNAADSKETMELSAAGYTESKYEEASCDGDFDYPLGSDGTCVCDDPDHQELIGQEEMCLEAATQAGVSAPPSNFILNEEWFNFHPKGCFKDTCKSDPKGQCYFFNPIGNFPAKCGNYSLPDGSRPPVTGVPVCRRVKYMNGTVDGNGGCPIDYGVIMDETNCTVAAECLGYCKGDEFRVTSLNQSRHDDFPQGCFRKSGDGEDGCVYYNPPLENWNEPKGPKGTPICNVTKRTWINAHRGGTSASFVEDRAGPTTITAAPAS